MLNFRGERKFLTVSVGRMEKFAYLCTRICETVADEWRLLDKQV